MADDPESLAHLMLTLVVFVGGRRGGRDGRDGLEMLFVEILKGSSKVKIPGKLGGVRIPNRGVSTDERASSSSVVMMSNRRE
jgi:hypothetical protein